jgi:hypothetical protein
MNRFQAMAQIMAILCEEGSLTPGTPAYKVARKMVARKIDDLGPDAAFEQATRWKGRILDEVRLEDMLADMKEKFPYLNF